MKGQAHDLERKQEVGEDDGGVDAEKLGGGDGDFGGECRLLADFEQGMLLANGAVLGHVASCLAHEPDGSAVDGLGLAGANEEGIGRRHELVTVAFLRGLGLKGRKGKSFNTEGPSASRMASTGGTQGIPGVRD